MKRVITSIFAICFVGFGAWISLSQPIEKHVQINNMIQSVSGMLLTVLGIWLAVMNPAAISFIFRRTACTTTTRSEDSEIESLLIPVLVILGVVTASFVAHLIIIFSHGYPWLTLTRKVAKVFSGAHIAASTFAILYGIISCILPIFKAIQEIESRRNIGGYIGEPDDIE